LLSLLLKNRPPTLVLIVLKKVNEIFRKKVFLKKKEKVFEK